MQEIGYDTVCLTFECPVVDDYTDWQNEQSIRVGREIMQSNPEYIDQYRKVEI